MENNIVSKLNDIIKDNVISFHMPGHKLGKMYERLGYEDIVSNFYKMDTTEIPGTDNLHHAEGVIKASQYRASKVFNSDATFYLVNGTTCGIQAAIMSICKPKDKIIINRDCHKSVINGCILGDVDVVYAASQVNKETGIISGINEDEIITLIDKNKDIKALILTYPTYHGMVYDLKYICDYAHDKDIVVIVDEAHGSHLGLDESLPKASLEQGADIVIQSTHKTLPSLTQTSMLHIQGKRVSKSKIAEVLSMIETSSPSYVFLSSLEVAVDIYEKYGKTLMKELINIINDFKTSLINRYNDTNNIKIYETHDVTKIFISLFHIGVSGYELEDILRKKYNIQVELSNYYGILLICTIGNEKADFDLLKEAFIDIIDNVKVKEPLELIDYPVLIPKKVLGLREAFYSDKKKVKIEESNGLVAGEYVIPYPPGISLLSPGEIITTEIIDYIIKCSKEGMSINGMEDLNLEYINVIDIDKRI